MFQSVQPIYVLSTAIRCAKKSWGSCNSAHIRVLIRHVVVSEVIVEIILLQTDQCQSLSCVRGGWRRPSVDAVLTPCECTIPLGVPVVPEENMMTKGVWKGTWANVSVLPVPRARKSSKDVLHQISKSSDPSNWSFHFMTDVGESKFSRGPMMIASVFPFFCRALIETASVLDTSCLLPL